MIASFYNKIVDKAVDLGAYIGIDPINNDQFEKLVKNSLKEHQFEAQGWKIFSLAVLITSLAFAVLGVVTLVFGVGLIILIPSALLSYLSYNSFNLSVNLLEFIEHPLRYINTENIIKLKCKMADKPQKDRLLEHPILKPTLQIDLQKNGFWANWMAELVFDSLKNHFENPNPRLFKPVS